MNSTRQPIECDTRLAVKYSRHAYLSWEQTMPDAPPSERRNYVYDFHRMEKTATLGALSTS